MDNKGKKVFVGLSGGVDSSVSALLLKEQGYDVTGVFIKAWHPEFIPCNWKDEMRDAMRVCARLDIPFLMLDLEREYKEEVIDNLIREYTEGRTPNPDVLCNSKIKFGYFLDFAVKNGANFVATGHYAKTFSGRMYIPKDLEKDQTYFLWGIKDLDKVIFPLANLDKSEVRKIAEKNNLHTAGKKDSQGLCFVGHVDMKSFLKRYIDVERGNVLDAEGNVIGYHEGAELYTIGERHGFYIQTHEDERDVRYVVSKDLKNNTITVDSELDSKEYDLIYLSDINLFREVSGKIKFRLRYRGEYVDGEYDDGVIRVSEKINVAIGQSIVMYIGDECVGGGIVSKLSVI